MRQSDTREATADIAKPGSGPCGAFHPVQTQWRSRSVRLPLCATRRGDPPSPDSFNVEGEHRAQPDSVTGRRAMRAHDQVGEAPTHRYLLADLQRALVCGSLLPPEVALRSVVDRGMQRRSSTRRGRVGFSVQVVEEAHRRNMATCSARAAWPPVNSYLHGPS